MQLSAHSPRKQQMYSRLRLINIHNRLNYSERHPYCGHDERKKSNIFPQCALSSAAERGVSTKTKCLLLCSRQQHRGSRESGPPAVLWIPFLLRTVQISPQNPAHYTWMNLGTYPGQARSLLTPSFRRNSPGPGGWDSWPPSVGRSLISSFHRENEKESQFFPRLPLELQHI